MDQREKNNQIAESIERSKKILILVSKEPTVDSFSAAAGLYHMLKEKEKAVDFIFGGLIPRECEGLLGINEVKSTLDAKELLVSIDYSTSPAAKAQYSTNNGVLLIKLSPIDKSFDISSVKSEIQGTGYDLIFTVGSHTTDDLGDIYNDLHSEFAKVKVVNIDIAENNSKYGFYNIIETSEPSISLVLLNTCRYWRLKVGQHSAKALLKGISHGMA